MHAHYITSEKRSNDIAKCKRAHKYTAMNSTCNSTHTSTHTRAHTPRATRMIHGNLFRYTYSSSIREWNAVNIARVANCTMQSTREINVWVYFLVQKVHCAIIIIKKKRKKHTREEKKDEKSKSTALACCIVCIDTHQNRFWRFSTSDFGKWYCHCYCYCFSVVCACVCVFYEVHNGTAPNHGDECQCQQTYKSISHGIQTSSKRAERYSYVSHECVAPPIHRSRSTKMFNIFRRRRVRIIFAC